MGRKIDGEARSRDIIVKFRKKLTKDKFCENKKKITAHEDPKENIYINDHLTKHRQHLLYVARIVPAAGKIYFARLGQKI